MKFHCKSRRITIIFIVAIVLIYIFSYVLLVRRGVYQARASKFPTFYYTAYDKDSDPPVNIRIHNLLYDIYRPINYFHRIIDRNAVPTGRLRGASYGAQSQ